MRVAGGSEAAPAFQRLFTPDDRIGHRPSPGASTHFATSEFATDIAINSLGVRGPEFPAAKTGKMPAASHACTAGWNRVVPPAVTHELLTTCGRKSGRGLALTDMGEEVYRYANDIFALGRELVDMVKGRPIGRPLLFRVGVKDALSKLVVFKLLEPHFQMTEKTRLVISQGEIAKLVANLSVHKLDVVLSDTQLDPLTRPGMIDRIPPRIRAAA